MPKIIIYILISLTLIGGILLFQNFFKYSEVMTINKDSYVILDNNIFVNLRSGMSSRENNIFYTDKKTPLYFHSGNYYIFNSKKQALDLEYPIISEEKVINLFAEVVLINDRFEEKQFNKFIMQDSKLYSYPSLIRKNKENYYFIKLNNNLYINTNSIIAKETIIDKHSIMIFLENEIRYYSLKNKDLELNKINLLAIDELQINGNIYSYEEIYKKIQGEEE